MKVSRRVGDFEDFSAGRCRMPVVDFIWSPSRPECEMTFFDIVLRTESSLHPEGEPDDFISEYTGIIRCFGEDHVVRRVGKVRAYRINAAIAADHGEPLFDVCDAHSQEMHRIHSLLYDQEEDHVK
jgi:hypothetical protein